jgi:threonine synthase
MNFVSTRGQSPPVRISQALERGLAPDGGLYVPSVFPSFDASQFIGCQSIPEIAERLLGPFFRGDVLEPMLSEICHEAFNFPIPLRRLGQGKRLLELYHGPTAAFKDVGARFLASCLSRLNRSKDRPLTILVATSGDTGSAVASAFNGKPAVEVIVLYPKGRVSPRQEKQLSCWGGNITTYAVGGDFDQCQQMVKEAFQDPRWRESLRLSSANSINVGRLLPQMVYYAAASLWRWREEGLPSDFVVPSGNVGNASACAWARECGLPIGWITLATNANRSIADYLRTGVYTPLPTIPTIANAMDVGNPSNMERLRQLHGDDLLSLRGKLRAISIGEDTIREAILSADQRWGVAICPHTACAVAAMDLLGLGEDILVATAHPAKFEEVVEPLLKRTLAVPKQLSELLDLPGQAHPLDAGLGAFTRAVLG